MAALSPMSSSAASTLPIMVPIETSSGVDITIGPSSYKNILKLNHFRCFYGHCVVKQACESCLFIIYYYYFINVTNRYIIFIVKPKLTHNRIKIVTCIRVKCGLWSSTSVTLIIVSLALCCGGRPRSAAIITTRYDACLSRSSGLRVISKPDFASVIRKLSSMSLTK